MTLRDGSVGVPNKETSLLAPENIAAHEACHSMIRKGIAEGIAFQKAVLDFADAGSDLYNAYAGDIVDAYFTQGFNPKNKRHQAKFQNELCAYISGDLYEGVVDISSMFHDYDEVKTAWQAMIDTARAEARKQIASETAAGTTEEEVKYSVEQTGRSGVPETASGFRERSNENSRRVGKIGGALYAFTPVGGYETSKAAEGIQRELKLLGINSFFHNGLEVNENGLTITAGDIATTIGREIVGIYKGAFANEKKVAGHEAYHF